MRKIELDFQLVDMRSSSYCKSLLIQGEQEMVNVDFNGMKIRSFFDQNVGRIIANELHYNICYIVREDSQVEVCDLSSQKQIYSNKVGDGILRASFDEDLESVCFFHQNKSDFVVERFHMAKEFNN